MTLSRMPLYAWAILVTAYMMLFGFTPLLVATTLLELDRKHGTPLLRPGGRRRPAALAAPVLDLRPPGRLHPVHPGRPGIVSLVIPAFARRPLVGENLIVASLIATASSASASGSTTCSARLSVLGMSFFAAASMAIAIPSGIQMFAWIATLWLGVRSSRPPLLFALGFIVTFVPAASPA